MVYQLKSNVNRSTTKLLRQVTEISFPCSHNHAREYCFRFFQCAVAVFYTSVFLSESDIYEDPSVRFESKKILQPDPTNMENYLVKNNFHSVYMKFMTCLNSVVQCVQFSSPYQITCQLFRREIALH